MIQPIIDCLLIKVESEIKTKVKSENGLELFIDPDLKNTELHSQAFEQIDYRQTSGVVVALPSGYSSPHYFYDNLVHEVNVGDKVYFHYTAVDMDSKVEYGNELYYTVPYEMVWCKIDDAGKITMIGGRVFCEELPAEDIQEIEINGTKIKVRMTGSGIVTEMNVKREYGKARLMHIGTPLNDQPKLDLVAGDIIFYAVDSDFVNVIEGKKYFCMTQEDILAKQM
jgi:co-chaperonin GroES (HSP10)